MAVYTEVSFEELEAFLAGYELGAPLSFKGIAEGVENTNYLVHTDKGPFLLTLYEKRVRAGDLPFFLGLLEHLAARGIACPLPVRNRSGEQSARRGRSKASPRASRTRTISFRRAPAPSSSRCTKKG